MAKLSGKVAVVTGASKGIGAAIARTLGEAGAAVVVNYAKDRAGAERVVADIVAREGKALAVQADVSVAADRERLFAETRRAFGALDVLVNNAGVYAFAPLEAVSADELHRMFDLNVLGLILTTREALRHFGPTGGSIINIGSIVGQKPVPASVATPPPRAPSTRDARARRRAGRAQDPRQLDQPRRRRDRGHAHGRHDRQRLREADDRADAARAPRAAGRHREDRAVSGVGGFGLDDGRAAAGVGRVALRG